MADGAELAVAFAHRLRSAGVEVPTSSVVAFAEAAAAVGVEERSGLYWAGRATLLRRPEDQPHYDEAFVAFWFQAPPQVSEPDPEVVIDLVTDESDDLDDAPPADVDDGGDGDAVVVRYSAAETLRHRDFGSCTPEELAEAHRLIGRIRFDANLRQSRRQRPSSARSGEVDLRRTVLRSIRAGGEPVPLATRTPRERPRPIVLLVDISGSMEPYAKALLRFGHVAVSGRTPVEVFTLGTRATRVTKELSTRDPDAALRAVGAAAADWSGGTRLGEAVQQFCDEWGMRGMARGARIVVLSDGWDRGDASRLGEQLARLRLVAHRIVWVNPLKASPGYAPLAAGMAAALPHLDAFLEGHSLASLEHLAEVLGGGR